MDYGARFQSCFQSWCRGWLQIRFQDAENACRRSNEKARQSWRALDRLNGRAVTRLVARAREFFLPLFALIIGDLGKQNIRHGEAMSGRQGAKRLGHVAGPAIITGAHRL